MVIHGQTGLYLSGIASVVVAPQQSVAEKEKEMGRSGCSVFRTLFAVLVVLVMCQTLLLADEGVPQEVLNAARQGIATFVKNPQTKNLASLGFVRKAQIDEAAYGQGFPVCYVPPDLLLAADANQVTEALIVPTNMWQFLVMSEGAAVSVLTVDYFKGQWTPVSIGASGLASELAALTEAWPQSAGYRYKLVRVYQAKAYFVQISLDEKSIGAVPLTSARLAMNLDDQRFNPLDVRGIDEILLKLRPLVRMNME